MEHAARSRWWSRCARGLAVVAQTGVVALALATLAGLWFRSLAPGASVHELWMGSTGAPGFDAWLAFTFSVLVLCHAPLARRWPRATRVAAVATGLLVATVT